jgi:uncharacterized protein YjbI with pentapeptide repeats
MQIIKPMALGLSTRCLEYRRRLGLSITACLYFPFRPAGQAALWTETSMWKFLATEMPEGPFIDEGGIKAHSEFLLRAHAFAPAGRAQAVEVAARVGQRVKRAHAVGPRHWVGQQASAPEPFERLPLDWRHTYGGPDYAPNPLGMGHHDRQAPADAAARQPLPQVVPLNQQPGSRFDTVPSIAFGPIDSSWPQRARHAGTYDDRWLHNEFPGLASDIDWRYFNLASDDQWFEAPPQGDETFEFLHMHPRQARVGGALPGLRARVFVDYGDGKTARLSEVPMRLTTLWFFPHAEVGIVLFHGLAECSEDDGADVHTLLGGVERIGQALDKAHYLQALQLRRDPRDGAVNALRESDLLPAGLNAVDPAFDDTLADYRADGAAADAMRRGALLKAQTAMDEARAAGVDPARLGLRLPTREPAPTLENLGEYLAKNRAKMLNAQVTAALDAAEEIAKAKAKAKALGIELDTLSPRGPPSYRAQAHLAELTQLAQAHPGLLDPAALAPQLRQTEQLARMNYLALAHMQAPAPRLPAARAQALRIEVAQAHAKKKSFLGADLTGADLSGLDLRGADFSSANLGRAVLKTTRLVKARLDRAIVSHTALAETDLHGAHIDGLQMHEATFGRADWRSVKGSGLVFIQRDLQQMVFNRAELPRVTFIECNLSGVDFSGAVLTGATFIKCQALRSRLPRAQLDGAMFVDSCDFGGADFSAAHLNGANLRGTSLAGANFAQARLNGSDLSDCNAIDANFNHASLQGAMLAKTVLSQARLQHADLLNALLPRADLRGADLSGANLFGTDMSRVWVDRTMRSSGANFERARTHPRRPATA